MAINITTLQRKKQLQEPIVALTAWEYATAQILDQAGVDILLVGDSLAMVALGHKNTLPITLSEIIHHAKAVSRAVQNALIVVDLPFMSYQVSTAQALHAAGQVLKETDAQAVKLEGGYPDLVATVQKLVQAGIPVMGHVGLTPQSVHLLGYRRQGIEPALAHRIYQEAQNLAAAGAFAVILEHIPAELGDKITKSLPIPTIGIGAGEYCDGQILVTHDLLGLSAWQPPFVRQYVDLRSIISQAVTQYGRDVRDRNLYGQSPGNNTDF